MPFSDYAKKAKARRTEKQKKTVSNKLVFLHFLYTRQDWDKDSIKLKVHCKIQKGGVNSIPYDSA